MRIAIDGTAPVVGGGVTWLREVVPALCAASPTDDFWLFLRSDVRGLNPRASANCRVVSIRLPQKLRVMWRLAWQQFILPIWLLRIKVDVLLAPNDGAPILAPCKVILGIQNANPYWGPSASSWLGRRREQFLRWQTRMSAWRVDKVFFVSEWSRQAISCQLRLPLEKTCVIYHGVSERFQPRDGGLIRPDEGSSHYVLGVGSVRSHKDYTTLIKAWSCIIANVNESMKLVFVGPVLEPDYHQKLLTLSDELKINNHVSFVPAVPLEEMVGFYQHAAALVMSSFVETFGLPMLEAMACGVPVIASDIPTAHEICGEAACYYSLEDPVDLAEKLALVLTQSDVRSRMMKRGRELSLSFSWSNHASLILQLMRETPGQD